MLDALQPGVFVSAKPVWPVGRETLINDFVGFRLVVEKLDTGPAVLSLAASTIYRVTVNGRFVGHGPARAAHGWYRVDQWDLAPFMKAAGDGSNVVAIEVAGYNANSYYVLDQPSFLQAELAHGGRFWGTGVDKGFEALDLAYKRRKVQRFSYQRPSMEAYVLGVDSQAWKTDPGAKVSAVKVAQTGPKALLPRRMPYPTFATRLAGRHVASGTVTPFTPEKIKKDRSLTNISPLLKGYPEAELEVAATTEFQCFRTTLTPMDKQIEPWHWLPVGEGTAQILDLGTNLSGFVGLTIQCQKPGRFAVQWEELLDEGDVKVLRVDCANMMVLDLTEPGTYEIETIEPYTLRYLKVMATSGQAQVRDVYLREYAHPEMEKTHFACSDPKLNRVYRAAVQTLRQNAADLLTDCPGRERAGWLCDSYFSARVALDLTGSTVTEAKFLEDYLLAPHIPPMPEGMIPMCYPADHPNGNFIPQWPMWLVLQLEEYLKRSGDRAMVDAYKAKVEGLIKYFEPFVNADGLLQKLEGWRFIEWSKANDFTLDVNYPTNMLFAGMLDCASRLYGRPEWATRADQMRRKILAQSFDGEWFVDNATLAPDGEPRRTINRTEVCQYYAFYFRVASPRSHPVLWKRLCDDFGPQRAQTGAFAEIHPANAFIGNYLRIELLSRENLTSQIEQEISGYFLKMADLTGTLWENDGTYASCNHGFASHVAHWLIRDIAGVFNLDTEQKHLTLKLTENSLSWCDLRLAVGHEFVELSWTKTEEGEYRYKVEVPQGYSVRIDTPLEKPDPDTTNPWFVVGNVVSSRVVGQEHKVLPGSKHFSAGTKVYCISPGWGDGGKMVYAVGMCRQSHKYIMVAMPAKQITNWRVQRVYKPVVLERLARGLNDRTKMRWYSEKTCRDFVAWQIECEKQEQDPRR